VGGDVVVSVACVVGIVDLKLENILSSGIGRGWVFESERRVGVVRREKGCAMYLK